MNNKIKKVLEAVAKAPTYRRFVRTFGTEVCCFCHQHISYPHDVGCPVPIAQELLKGTHPHLSTEQKAEIREVAFNRIKRSGSDFSISKRLNTLSIKEQLEEIDLGALFFDPETGEDYEE